MSNEFEFDVRLQLEDDHGNELPSVRAMVPHLNLELWIIKSTPTENNCHVMHRSTIGWDTLDVKDRNTRGWRIDLYEFNPELNSFCKIWYNHYKPAFTLQEFLDGI